VAVRIRLARLGRKKTPFYRIVVADGEMRRDGRHIEQIGSMNPKLNPPAVELKEDRLRYWVGEGALPSDTVAQLVEKRIPGFLSSLEEARKAKIRSKRAARKARSAGKTPAAKTAKTKTRKAPAKKTETAKQPAA
jgi:small subunit ribosomal protein S16